MTDMTRSRWYSTVVPLAALVYVIVLFATDFATKVVVIGALAVGLISMVGTTLLTGGGPAGRQRARRRNRKNF